MDAPHIPPGGGSSFPWGAEASRGSGKTPPVVAMDQGEVLDLSNLATPKETEKVQFMTTLVGFYLPTPQGRPYLPTYISIYLVRAIAKYVLAAF